MNKEAILLVETEAERLCKVIEKTSDQLFEKIHPDHKDDPWARKIFSAGLVLIISETFAKQFEK